MVYDPFACRFSGSLTRCNHVSVLTRDKVQQGFPGRKRTDRVQPAHQHVTTRCELLFLLVPGDTLLVNPNAGTLGHSVMGTMWILTSGRKATNHYSTMRGCPGFVYCARTEVESRSDSMHMLSGWRSGRYRPVVGIPVYALRQPGRRFPAKYLRGNFVDAGVRLPTKACLNTSFAHHHKIFRRSKSKRRQRVPVAVDAIRNDSFVDSRNRCYAMCM